VAVFTLSIHAGYRCRRSGACCTAGWRIPVERETERRLAGSGLIRLSPASAAAVERDGELAVLATAQDGACVFFERSTSGRQASCAIHRVLGHDALPAACRHFPRVSVTDDRATFVTLSHFCPSAATLLFSDNADLSIVEPHSSFGQLAEYEGLDARGVLPPLLRPGVLMDLDSHHAWQAGVIRVMADPAHTPESAVAELERAAERVRTWAPGEGTLCERIDHSWSRHFRSLWSRDFSRLWSRDFSPGDLYELVRSCVPAGLDSDPLPDDLEAIDAALVEPAWPNFAVPIKRYLAAKAFASWIPWHARDLRVSVGWLAAARTVLRIESARQCGKTGRLLDRSQLLEAVRRADLLLVHKISIPALADRLGHQPVNGNRAVPA
jgi:Fe-S-cluster containining protein